MKSINGLLSMQIHKGLFKNNLIKKLERVKTEIYSLCGDFFKRQLLWRKKWEYFKSVEIGMSCQIIKKQMHMKFKIILTNWINIIGVFVAVYIYGVIDTLLYFVTETNSTIDGLRLAFLGSLLAIVIYGMIFWIGFIASLIITDAVLNNTNQNKLYFKLMIQWGLISLPFVYWLFRYEEWIFLVAVVAFFITQNFRRIKIVKILKK